MTDDQLTAEAQERAYNARQARDLERFVAEHIDRRKKSIEERVYQALKVGKLDEKQALLEWCNMHALHEFAASLRRIAEGRGRAR